MKKQKNNIYSLLFHFFLPFILSLTRFKRAVSNRWCFSATNRPKLNTPHRTTKTASYETSFFALLCSAFAWHRFPFSFRHQIVQIKVEIRFRFFFLLRCVFRFYFRFFPVFFVALWKEKSRFSIKFQTFWWKLSRFYCWKCTTSTTQRKEMEGKCAHSFDSAHTQTNLLCFFAASLSVSRLKLGFFHRLCKFMKMFRLYFPAKYTGI